MTEELKKEILESLITYIANNQCCYHDCHRPILNKKCENCGRIENKVMKVYKTLEGNDICVPCRNFLMNK